MNVEHKECGGDFASKTQANTNSWIAGIAALLALANGGCGNGNIVNRLLGGGGGCGNGGVDLAAAMAMLNAGNNCGDGAAVNRYESGLQSKIAALEADVKLRDANTYTMGEMAKLRDYVDAKFDKVDARLCKQAEWNAAQTAGLTCMQGQIAQLFSLTKLVVPNTSVCPGWGNVTVAPESTTAA